MMKVKTNILDYVKKTNNRSHPGTGSYFKEHILPKKNKIKICTAKNVLKMFSL